MAQLLGSGVVRLKTRDCIAPPVCASKMRLFLASSRRRRRGECSSTCGVRARPFQKLLPVMQLLTGAALFGLFTQDGAGSRINVVDLAANGAGHRLIDVVVLRDVLGNKALNALSG